MASVNLDSRCPTCGSVSPAGSIWCSNCGLNLQTGKFKQQVAQSYKPSRVEKMVEYNLVWRHVGKIVGFLLLLMILGGVAAVLYFF